VDTSKIDRTINRIHFTTEGEDAPNVEVDGANGAIAAARIEQYAGRHGLSLWALGQATYWPSTANDMRHRRNVARIVANALGF
jgi:hypothetical protein